MNERIRELKEQARDFYLNQEDLDRSPQELHNAVEEKFAELIIRECMDVVALRPYIDDGTWNHPSIMIKKYFGVE